MSDRRRPAEPFDPGLQPERTLLSWRRTCLSLGVVGTLAIRFVADQWGIGAVVAGVVVVVLAGLAYLTAGRRYARVNAALTGGDPVLVSGGVSITLLAACVLVVAVAASWYVLG